MESPKLSVKAKFLLTGQRILKSKKAILLIIVISAVIYIEFLSYILTKRSWPMFNVSKRQLRNLLDENEIGKPFDLRDVDPLRVLLVADPQILGEKEHPFYYSPFAIWDSDRYLQQNYMVAKDHIQPNIVIFLGDLTNEGLSAHDTQYRRYYNRFTNIFQIPRKADPSEIEYIYLPGDNDVGGENEPVDSVKLKWFNYTFGDYHKPFKIHEHGWDLQILKLWAIDFKRTHLTNPMIGNEISRFQIVVSHLPLLKFRTESTQKLVDLVNPSLIISAHDHHSTLYSYDKILKQGIKYTFDFLKLDDKGRYPEKFRFEPGNLVYEIGVPTCSYRMGVKDMGFGAIELYKNGTTFYSVLWLKSRFTHLYLYIIIYLILKLILARFILQKVWIRCCQALTNRQQKARKYFKTNV